MAKKGRAARKPENPKEALARLHTIAEHSRETFKAYRAHKPPMPVAGDDVESYVAARGRRVQWLADMRCLWCFADVVKVYGSSENKERLDQLLGLKAGRGRPVDQDRRDKILEKLLEIVLLLEPRGPTRQGKPARPSWKEIGPACGMTPQAAKRLVERELPNLPEAVAKEIAARMKLKPPPIGKAKARSAALGKEIAARNRRAHEAKARRRSQSKKPAR